MEIPAILFLPLVLQKPPLQETVRVEKEAGRTLTRKGRFSVKSSTGP